MKQEVLRPYQTKGVDDVLSALEAHHAVMYQLPTGGGKTVVMAELIRRWHAQGLRQLVLVHRDFLVEQIFHRLMRIGLRPAVIQGDMPTNYVAGIQVASIMSLRKRLLRIPYTFHRIITDEAHHATAESYQMTYNAFPEAKRVGFTATPWRMGKEGFEGIYSQMVHGPTVRTLIAAGYLVPHRVYARPLNFDLKQVKVSAGDYNIADLRRYMDTADGNEFIVREFKAKYGQHRGVCFACDVDHAKHIVERYRNNGVAAAHIDAETGRDERRRIIADFRAGHIQMLTNCQIFTEGFDLPNIGVVQMARPTKSLALYLQMAGRGSRPAEGKEACILLDYANNVLTHGMPDHDHAWTLAGKPEPRVAKIMQRREDGRLVRPERGNSPYSMELVEVKMAQPQQGGDAIERDWFKLKGRAVQKGYKPYWAVIRLMEKHPKITIEQLEWVGVQMGYANYASWARHKHVELRAKVFAA